MNTETAAFFENPTRASLNYLVLMLLKSAPKHGYMLMQDIERHTEGGWKPSHSAIYKLLNGFAGRVCPTFMQFYTEGVQTWFFCQGN